MEVQMLKSRLTMTQRAMRMMVEGYATLLVIVLDQV
jgi:hypothetical protein